MTIHHHPAAAPRHTYGLEDSEGEALDAAAVSAELLAAADQGEASYARLRGWPHRSPGMNSRVPEGGVGCCVTDLEDDQ